MTVLAAFFKMLRAFTAVAILFIGVALLRLATLIDPELEGFI